MVSQPLTLEVSDRQSVDTALEQVERLYRQLEAAVRTSRNWLGPLRRILTAQAAQGVMVLDGYLPSLDDAADALDGEDPVVTDEETKMALYGYRDASRYIRQISRDGDCRIDGSTLRSMHFLLLRHDLRRNPGRWRAGTSSQIDELMTWLIQDDSPLIVKAATIHLALHMIRPFSDGNGRMATCAQSLVLAQDTRLDPVLHSIEEYIGANTDAYHAIMAGLIHDSWPPAKGAEAWIRFCVTAHYRQAQTLLVRVANAERLWSTCTLLAVENHLPVRSVGPLTDAALGMRLRNGNYRAVVAHTDGELISDQTASRDLKLLVDAGLLNPIGEKRARVYRGSLLLRAAWAQIRAQNEQPPPGDPFASA